MRTDQFAYALPPARIAQEPVSPRDSARLLRLDRQDGALSDHTFRHLDRLLRRDDLLVLNDTRVFRARLLGTREATGGKIEALLLHPEPGRPGHWMAWTRSGGRLRPGERLSLAEGRLTVTLVERRGAAGDLLEVPITGAELVKLLGQFGLTPLPPYITRQPRPADEQDYQTVYARHRGAVAAPTAGLHFTDALLKRLEQAGIERTAITLHVGPGTFRPVKAERIADHEMLSERYEVSAQAAEAIARARKAGRRVVAVGTTVTRTLEARARQCGGPVRAGKGQTELFIYPPFEFQVTGALITNFHLPRSTLLMLVSAFASREQILRAYQHALDADYRFFSYGDAMLIE
jgi:S-adenosylmethionine:tRNA ribosyltransferase-isomerase